MFPRYQAQWDEVDEEFKFNEMKGATVKLDTLSVNGTLLNYI